MELENTPQMAPQPLTPPSKWKAPFRFTKHKLLPFTQKRWKLLLILAIILLPILWGAVWLFSPEEPEVVLATAMRGDLVQTVEAVGTVISEKDLKLRFPVTGVVAEVFVDEGATVTSGQELARLKNEALQADVNGAAAKLASRRAELNELIQGARPEDIAIAEAEVANKRASLDAAYTTLAGAEEKLKKAQEKLNWLNREAETSLAGYVTTANSESSEQLAAARSSLRKLEDIFGDNALTNTINYFETTRFAILQKKLDTATNALSSATQAVNSDFANYRSALSTLDQVRSAIVSVSIAINESYSFVASLPLSGSYGSSDREAHKTTLSTESSAVQVALSSIDSTAKSIRDAGANFDSKISTEELNVATAQSTQESALSDILTYETALRTQEAQLGLKKAGSRQTAIDSSRAMVNQAAAEYDRAKAQFDDTVLRAPIDGTITKVNLKPGEFTGGLDLQEYSFSMLGASPYRIDMFVAEIDIPKVQMSQTGAIDLDAFPEENFIIKVSEIDPAASNIDGVSKYRVKLDFIKQDDRLKIGMTGDSEIFTNKREDIVIIPGRAVLTSDEGKIVRIYTKDGEIEERIVETGMSGEGGDIEVVSGIEEDETIVILIKE
ncbi:efflux RND transporter periplasmic adaptor subunit [Patescibacteria group bacterium]|nr:efflux RND transporter periplasmic adaptor subunit [Patescibacteria group bacterium]